MKDIGLQSHDVAEIGISSAWQAGFDELESEDIEEVLASHTEELTNEDLQQLTEHSAVEDHDEEEPHERQLSRGWQKRSK
ncbi:hypothetical protein Hamer_G003921 [Homarus americanus]|uniref:Uncharacterized protein n=1 Tax=Homarus americanus TaxID=6706 RepID=A0A8J5NEP3_HOMAM|nr:hypothetical protein Hamer_G003921 [Homarus americanus]